MLSFFRRITRSRLGVIITLGVLAVIAVAFAIGDIAGVRSGATGAIGGSVLTVGGTSVGESELRERTQSAFNGVRQQNPGLDIATFVTAGGFDQVIARTINGIALQEFAESIGMIASKQAIDGEIASIPAFQGPDGKFSQTTYEQLLSQQRLTDAQLREDIARDILARQLIAPTAGASQIPTQFALPYASLLLERRQGVVGFVPTAAVPQGPAPTPAEIQTYYTRQRARYTVPERRSLRYAVVRADGYANQQVTQQEVAAAYRAQAARFAATEKRTLTQVILLDQNAANQLAARVKGGAPIAEAARAAGLEASTATGVEKAAFAQQSSPAAADAAFAAAQGSVVGPVRAQVGWAVIRVDAVTPVAGKTLAQATPELTEELKKTKAQTALQALREKLDDAIGGGSTFDELVADAKLQAQTTKPLLASGVDPIAPGQQPDPLVARLLPAAFQSEPGDDPQVVAAGEDGSFAVVALGQVVPAAPRPLAEVRDQVAKDFVTQRAVAAARKVAADAVARIDKGTPIAEALRQSGLTVPAPRPLNASRAQLAAQRAQLPPPVVLMFSMAARKAKLLEAPEQQGWFVVYLDSIQSGDAKGNQALIANARRGLGSVSGQELAEQFTAAVKKEVGVKQDSAAVAKLKADLAGGAAPAN